MSRERCLCRMRRKKGIDILYQLICLEDVDEWSFEEKYFFIFLSFHLVLEHVIINSEKAEKNIIFIKSILLSLLSSKIKIK
jgi:hypothetical protein